MKDERISGAGRSVVVVGAGGNVGSHLVPHLGRMRNVARVTLVDFDSYEPKNLRAQAITPEEVGRPKASVQALRLRRVNPALDVRAHVARVEDVPLGLLRADALLACLDSRRARQYVNWAARRLGVVWVDSGVEAAGLLARVNVYSAGDADPCMECAWDERDYAALEQRYPCAARGDDGALAAAPPTDAPSYLGALAASLVAVECEKVLAGDLARAAVSRQVTLDAAHHRQLVASFRRRETCRLPSHEPWTIERLARGPADLTLAETFALREGAETLSVAGGAFVTRLACPRCGHARELLRLRPSLSDAQRACPRCASRMASAGSDTFERLARRASDARSLKRTLRALGLRRGEVFTLEGAGAVNHYELG